MGYPVLFVSFNLCFSVPTPSLSTLFCCMTLTFRCCGEGIADSTAHVLVAGPLGGDLKDQRPLRLWGGEAEGVVQVGGFHLGAVLVVRLLGAPVGDGDAVGDQGEVQ